MQTVASCQHVLAWSHGTQHQNCSNPSLTSYGRLLEECRQPGPMPTIIVFHNDGDSITAASTPGIHLFTPREAQRLADP